MAKRLVEPPGQRPAQRRRLLVDLLGQEVARGRRARRRASSTSTVRGRRGVRREPSYAAAVSDGELAVGEEDHLAGVAHQRGDVGGHEHLAVAEPEHDRAAVAGHDELVGAAGVEHDEPVGALDHAQRLADRVLERARAAVQRLRDQVRRAPRCRCPRRSVDALGGQLGAQLVGVLDDAVVHDRDAALGVGVRVGVGARSARRGWPSGCGRCRSGPSSARRRPRRADRPRGPAPL